MKKSSSFPGSRHALTVALGLTAMLGVSQSAQAHIEYYDLNQGVQILDLTVAGKTASTAQYGNNPVVTGDGVGAATNILSDRPLNNPVLWNAGNQVVSAGSELKFTNVSYNPVTGAGTARVNIDTVNTQGWVKGTLPQLGDSHGVDFFNFRLATASKVSIDWSVWNVGSGNFYDGGFSLYRGVLAYQAHDNGVDMLNPLDTYGEASVQGAFDTGSVADAQGIASAARDTVNTVYTGQFNALGNWGQGNVSGNWSNIALLTAVNNLVLSVSSTTNSALTKESLVDYMLPAGNYTIAASGAKVVGSTFPTNLHGQLNFSAVPTAVPVPGAVWLFGSAMAGLVGLGRRKALVA